jgi:hypothetical protein
MALAEVPAARTQEAPSIHSAAEGSPPDLSVVVVNWSTRDDLRACLESLGEALGDLSAQVVVVDNASSDGSARMVSERFPAMDLIQNRRNAGFARANNQAFQRSRGRYLLLLNPDTLANAAAIRGLLDFMERTPDAGAAGLQLRFPDGRLQNSYDSFPTFASELISKHLMRLLFPARYPSKRVIPEGPLPVDIVIGACLILRREVVEALGGFDEGYFLFVEEADLCYRIHQAGWEIYHLPGLSIVHDAKASKAQATAHAYIEYARSSYRFYTRCMRIPTALTLRALKSLKVVLVNPLLSLTACAFTLGSVPRHRRRLSIRAHLCAWHLLGCPRSWGMRQVSPLLCFERVAGPGRETIVERGAGPWLRALAEEFTGREGEEIAAGGRNGVRWRRVRDPDSGETLRVAVYRPRHPADWLRALLAVPRGILALERAEELRDRGIAAAAPRAAGTVRRWGLPVLSFAIHSQEPALFSLRTATMPGAPERNARLDAGARFLRRLHDAGVDLGARALSLVSFREGSDPQDPSALVLNSPERIKLGPTLGRGQRRRALEKVAASGSLLSPYERRRFLLSYWGSRKSGAPRRPLRVLHLFANHKVTGPAETALDAARAVGSLKQVAAEFAAGRGPDETGSLRKLAVERGARVTGLDLRLSKHFSPFGLLRDVRRLRRWLRADAPDVVHCHLPGDHLVAALAAPREIPIVRTLYDGEPPPWDWRSKLTLRERCAKVICFSQAAATGLEDLGMAPERVALFEPPIDLQRFHPARPLPDRRTALGIPPEAFTVGIVARLQTHRRFEVLFEAIDQARRVIPQLRLVVVGRGTHAETVAHAPVRERGLEETVVLTGYLSGDDYAGTLAALDAAVFLVPGSDGTCRAVREALAMGLPVIAARRGMLPELVRDGETGLVIDDTPENLAQAFVRLAHDREERRRMSEAARADAHRRFSYASHAAALLILYRDALAER